MQDGAQGEAHFRQGSSGEFELFEGIAAYADEYFGLQDLDEAHKVALAGGIQCFHLALGQLCGGDVGAGFTHPDEGAVVGHVGLLEKCFCCAVHILEQAPETPAAHF